LVYQNPMCNIVGMTETSDIALTELAHCFNCMIPRLRPKKIPPLLQKKDECDTPLYLVIIALRSEILRKYFTNRSLASSDLENSGLKSVTKKVF